MDWLRRLWNVVTGVLPVVPAIQRVVTAVQRVMQQVRTATVQPPGAPPPETDVAARAAQEAAVAHARQQQAQRQQAAQLDRDIGQRADAAPFPAITPAEKRAMRELLASPTNRSLHLLVEPDADVVLKIARQVPGILETAVQIHGSFKGAFDYLLADGVSLSEEEIAALLGQVGPMLVGQADPCFVYPGWEPYVDEDIEGTCRYRGDVADDRFDALLTPEQLDRYMRSKGSNNDNLRRLFLEPAQLLNNPALTNMSDNAFTMLIASQVFAEEKWHKGLRWIHPFYNRGDDPWPEANSPFPKISLLGWSVTGTVNDKRLLTGSLAALAALAISEGRYVDAQQVIDRNRLGLLLDSAQPQLLRGWGYGLGNQTFAMAWAAAEWYEKYAAQNAEAILPSELPSVVIGQLHNEFFATLHLIAELGDYGATPLDEVPDPKLGQMSSFWNAMRFLFAAAAQREGNSEPSGNLNYTTLVNRSESNPLAPPGRPIGDVSAFSLLTTVYSGSVTVPEFALFSMGADRADDDALGAAIAERNKAIEVVERMTNEEGQYRIGQPMGIAPLTTKYEDPINGDFLPYSREEAELLVHALVHETPETPTPDTQNLLCRATLLRQAYEFYFSATAWNDSVGTRCGG